MMICLSIKKMSFRFVNSLIIPLVACLLLTIFPYISNANAGSGPKILILHSYHQGYLWTDMIQEGVSRSLSASFPNAELYVEYMNTKRQVREVLFPQLQELYRLTYKNTQFDVIVASDNNALDFLLLYRDSLFPGVPVVFCGINNIFKYKFTPEGNYTGVNEDLDIESTIAIALKLHPKTKKVAIITDATETGLINLDLARKTAQKFPAISFIELHRLTAENLSSRLRQLEDDTIVLALSFFRDPDGKTFTQSESMEFIVSASGRPVYTVWDFYMTPGAVGGKLLSGRLQGENAAMLVSRVLRGEKAGEMPIIESPTAYIFDYVGLQKFNISDSQLPFGALVTGRPDTFYSRYKYYIWFGSGLFTAQVIIILILLWNINKRKGEERARKSAESALQESETRYADIVNNIQDTFYRTDADGLLTMVNPSGAALLGYDSTDEMIGRPNASFWMYQEKRTEMLELLERDGVVRDHEVVLQRRDGSPVIVATTTSYYYDKDGHVLGVEGIFRDITERKRSEENLRQEQMFSSALLESLPGIFYLYSYPELKLIRWNKQHESLFGYQPGDIDGRSIFSWHPPEAKNAVMDAAKRVMELGQASIATTLFSKDGTPVPFLLTGVKFESLGRSYLMGTGIDITELKRSQEELSRQNNLISTIIESASESIFAKDTSGVYKSINQAGARMLGLSVAEVLGHTDDELLPAEIAKQFRKTDEQILTGGVESECEETGDWDGCMRTFLTHKTPWRDTSGNIIGIIGVSNDITGRKEHEKEQQKIEKLESLGVLAGGIAHDFNNILTGIMGNISFAKMCLDATHKSYQPLLEAEKASARAGGLAHQLLTFARGGEPVKKVVSLQHIIHETVSFVLHGSNVKGDVDIPDSIHAIEADEGQLSQVFHNIVINAVQAMPGGGNIYVTAENEKLNAGNLMALPEGDYVKLSFTDQGCGIPESDLIKIFDPYFTTKFSGNGLGLASAHSIVSRHGGQIGAISTAGIGTTFTIHLPSIGETYSAFQTESVVQAADTQKSGSILVMDDEEMILDMVVGMLEYLGYTVTKCLNGSEAIAQYKAAKESGSPFSAVIMDLTIPGGMGGKEAAVRILKIDPQACLVVSSGYSNDPIISDFKSYGFNAAIVKPYTMNDLGKLLSSLLAS
ncbi:MAG: PAS/PAC sensor hybrid histidine [Desulfobulbaceae bacterium]|nr:MAG: PAS/PAC sensor hybrid histidine [Desulfobulbaceae bacterium]